MSNQDKYTVVEYRKNKKNNNYEEEFKNLQKRLHSPKVDLFERDSSYFVTIELPGVDSNSLKITFKDDQILFVSGSKLKDYILNTDKSFTEKLNIMILIEELNYQV